MSTDNIKINPFLHHSESGIYNPLTDQSLDSGDKNLGVLRNMRGSTTSLNVDESLFRGGFVLDVETDPSHHYLLKYVSIETHTVCNHKCYFCPVSVHTRDRHFMDWKLFERIAQELSEEHSGIAGVFLNGYNEPTIDPNFLDQVRLLKNLGIGVAVNSNGSGLHPKTTDALLSAGGLDYLCINLSTLDEVKFAKDRQVSHLDSIVRNVDYIANKGLAKVLNIVVLGEDDAPHNQAFEEISNRYGASEFKIKRYKVNSRSGRIDVFQQTEAPHKKLRGCDQTGSRPLQHLHVNALGQCILCCQDYYDEHVVGDLNTQSIHEVMSGPEMAQLRRWVYGVENAPDDFICRNCVFALTDE